MHQNTGILEASGRNDAVPVRIFGAFHTVHDPIHGSGY